MSDVNDSAIGKNLADVQAVGQAAKQVGEQAQTAGTEAVGHLKDLAGDAKDRVTSLADVVGGRVTSTAESGKQDLAGRLEDVAQAVHRSGEQLEGQQDWIAHMVERGAAELSALATTLKTNDLQSLLGSLGSLARRQPALFVGASMAAGFAMARVGRIAVVDELKAASPNMTESADERR
jgi:hypothetical protein